MSSNAAPVWSDEEIQTLIRLWNQGLAASAIGKTLKRSRSAVCGRVDRLRRAGHVFLRPLVTKVERTTRAKAGKVSTHDIRSADAWPHRPLPKFASITDATHAKPWTERAFGECAFPISGTGAETFSCCAPTRGRTYCGLHRAIMFAAPKPPKVRAYRPQRAA